MDAGVYPPVLDVLTDHTPKTLAQIELSVKAQGISFAQVVQAILVLAGTGQIATVQNDSVIAQSKAYTDKLNTHLITLARGRGDISYLASPITGGGVTVGRFQQLFLLARRQGHQQPADWARFAWEILAAQNAKLIKEGKALETAEENYQLLLTEAIAFAEKQLHILIALQIAS
jgi:hypothetical protein